MPAEIKKYDYIDAMRGLAIMMVLIAHTNALVNTSGVFWSFVTQGARGVQLFYIASALTLCLSFYARYQKETHAIKNFFIRRFFRIAPLYYLAIAYYGLTYFLIDRSMVVTLPHISGLNVLSNFLFLHSLSPYWINVLVPAGWSVSVEFIFYFLLPFLFMRYLASKNREIFLQKLLMASLFICVSFQYILIKYPLIDFADKANVDLWSAFLFYFFPNQFPVFVIGMLVFHKLKKKDVQDATSPKSFKNIFLKKELFFIGFLAVLSFVFRRYVGINLLSSFIFYSFAFGYFILTLESLKEKPNYFYKLFVNRLTEFMGRVSYSVYLVHFGVIFLILKYKLFSPLNYFNSTHLKYFLAFVFLTLFASLVSLFTYRFIEKPGINLGKRLIEKYLENDTI